MTRAPEHRRHAILAAALAAALLLSAAWMYADLAERRTMAQHAAEDVAACEQLAEQIRDLRRQPSLARSHEMEHQELTRRIEAAAQAAQLPAASLVSIAPAPAQRINRTPYKRKSTQVQFTGVTLPQLVRVLGSFAAEEAGPKVTQLRLAAPRDQQSGDRWSAEVTLTYLIYAPTSQRNSS